MFLPFFLNLAQHWFTNFTKSSMDSVILTARVLQVCFLKTSNQSTVYTQPTSKTGTTILSESSICLTNSTIAFNLPLHSGVSFGDSYAGFTLAPTGITNS